MLVSFTLTDVTEVEVPLATVKGSVNLNWPPNGFDAELAYHVVNALPSVTGTSPPLLTVLPVATAKTKSPLTTSRVVE